MYGRKEVIIEVDKGVYVVVSKKYSSITVEVKEMNDNEDLNGVEPTATLQCKLHRVLEDSPSETRSEEDPKIGDTCPDSPYTCLLNKHSKGTENATT